MSKSIHLAYITFLIASAAIAAVVILMSGWSYYTTPLEERPFHPQYETLKPTGIVGHGFGVVGSFMIIAGVTIYSSRKRLRLFSGVGKIKHFLEFHIYLCLLGPVLVLYHTTFKFGGLVAVSFWSMVAVVASGVVGRYLYTQIPKGIQGNALTIEELTEENERLATQLVGRFHLSRETIDAIDAFALPPKPVARMSIVDILRFFIINDVTRRSRLNEIFRRLSGHAVDPRMIRRLRLIARRRITLTRRIAFLEKFKGVFHYWHVVHLPFSIIMFAILGVHVGVAVAFGYTWIF